MSLGLAEWRETNERNHFATTFSGVQPFQSRQIETDDRVKGPILCTPIWCSNKLQMAHESYIISGAGPKVWTKKTQWNRCKKVFELVRRYFCMFFNTRHRLGFVLSLPFLGCTKKNLRNQPRATTFLYKHPSMRWLQWLVSILSAQLCVLDSSFSQEISAIRDYNFRNAKIPLNTTCFFVASECNEEKNESFRRGLPPIQVTLPILHTNGKSWEKKNASLTHRIIQQKKCGKHPTQLLI